MPEELLSSGLSTVDFPFVAPPDGLLASAKDDGGRTARAKGKASGGGAAEVPASGRRLIVFVIGGMSYSELRCVHEVGRALNREILAGATSMLTPQTFLLALKQMKQLEPVALV